MGREISLSMGDKKGKSWPMQSREALVDKLKLIEIKYSEVIHSHNLWRHNGSKDNEWVAGVYQKIDEKNYLLGQEQIKLLENFSLELPLFFPNLESSEHLASELKPGDKIALQFSGPKVIKVMLITANQLPEGKDPFDSINRIRALNKWNQFIKKIHAFFQELNFMHVTTPHLVESTGMESAIHPLSLIHI